MVSKEHNTQHIDERAASTAARDADVEGSSALSCKQAHRPALSRKASRCAFVALACAAAVVLVISVGSLIQYAQSSDEGASGIPSAASMSVDASSDAHSSDATSSASVSDSSGTHALSGAQESGSASASRDTENTAGASSSGSSGSSGTGNSTGNSGEPSSSTRSPESATVSVSITIDATAAGSNALSGTVRLPRGATSYDALIASGARVSAHPTTFGMYVAAINGLAEKEHGAMSGWLYAINGTEPQVACDQIALSEGDSVVWRYSTG